MFANFNVVILYFYVHLYLWVIVSISLYTDSLYIKYGITEWINKWKMNGWKTSNKKSVKNIELWKELDNAALQHEINWNWVKAHNGDKYNEEADILARKAIINA